MRGWGDRLPEGLRGHKPICLRVGATQDNPGDLTPRWGGSWEKTPGEPGLGCFRKWLMCRKDKEALDCSPRMGAWDFYNTKTMR